MSSRAVYLRAARTRLGATLSSRPSPGHTALVGLCWLLLAAACQRTTEQRPSPASPASQSSSSRNAAQADADGTTDCATAPGEWSVSHRLPPPVPVGEALGVALPDGRIRLVDGNGVLSFEPLANRWTAGEPLDPSRAGQGMVALSDGRVLVLGGEVTFGTGECNADLYEGEHWTPAGQLVARRSHPAATRLANGDVLVTGGHPLTTPFRWAFSHAELWRATQRRFEAVAPMHTARRGHAAVLLDDGRVLVVGGESKPGQALATTELFDPKQNAWKPGAPLPKPAAAPRAARTEEGTVVVSSRSGLFLWSSASGRWATLSHAPYPASPIVPLAGCAALVVSEFKVESWDLKARRRTARYSPLTARVSPVAASVDPRHVLVTGGHVPLLPDRTTDLWILGDTPAPPAELSWRLPDYLDLALPVAGHALPTIALDSHRFLSVHPPRSLVIDPRRRSVTRTTGGQAASRQGAALATLSGGGVLMVGGVAENHTEPETEQGGRATIGSTEILAPDSLTWRTAAPPHVPRWGATATTLSSGEVVLLGGMTESSPTRTVEVREPREGRWKNAGQLVRARVGHTATRLADERILVVGGCGVAAGGVRPSGAGAAGHTAELWQPSSSRGAGQLGTARCGHVAVLLADDRVLVAGGFSAGAFVSPDAPTGTQRTASAEIWDPQRNAWTPAAPMLTARARAAAAQLADGRVLVVGGQLPPGNGELTAEVYDPPTNAWRVVGTLPRNWSYPRLAKTGPNQLLLCSEDAVVELELLPPNRAR